MIGRFWYCIIQHLTVHQHKIAECIITGYPHVFARVSSGFHWMKNSVCARLPNSDICKEKKPVVKWSSASKSSKSKSSKSDTWRSAKSSKSAKYAASKRSMGSNGWEDSGGSWGGASMIDKSKELAMTKWNNSKSSKGERYAGYTQQHAAHNLGTGNKVPTYEHTTPFPTDDGTYSPTVPSAGKAIAPYPTDDKTHVPTATRAVNSGSQSRLLSKEWSPTPPNDGFFQTFPEFKGGDIRPGAQVRRPTGWPDGRWIRKAFSGGGRGAHMGGGREYILVR